MKSLKPIYLAGFVILAMMHTVTADDREAGHQAMAGYSVLSLEELAAHRGADKMLVIVSSQQEMSSGVKGSSFTVGTMNNGNIHVGDRAYEGFSGLGVNVLNTGNANAFSTGISMSVYLH
ncbi:MAG: hypothetical protein ABR558_03610 [Thioalkalivibrio sp.]